MYWNGNLLTTCMVMWWGWWDRQFNKLHLNAECNKKKRSILCEYLSCAYLIRKMQKLWQWVCFEMPIHLRITIVLCRRLAVVAAIANFCLARYCGCSRLNAMHYTRSMDEKFRRFEEVTNQFICWYISIKACIPSKEYHPTMQFTIPMHKWIESKLSQQINRSPLCRSLSLRTIF